MDCSNGEIFADSPAVSDWYKKFMDQYFFHATLSRLKQIDVDDYYASFDFNQFESCHNLFLLFLKKINIIALDTLFGCKIVRDKLCFIKDSLTLETSTLLNDIFQKQNCHFTFFSYFFIPLDSATFCEKNFN